MACFWTLAEGRRWVRCMPKARRQDRYGLKVLNLFAYTCAFSVVALQGGAKQVVNVDEPRRHGHWPAKPPAQWHHHRGQLFSARHFQQLGQRSPHSGPYKPRHRGPASYQRGSFVATKDYAASAAA